MARTALKPLPVSSKIQVNIDKQLLSVKGSKGELKMALNPEVAVKHDEHGLHFSGKSGGYQTLALCGTMRALARNMIKGVTDGYERRLELVGVGLRAQSQGKTLSLTLGFSHPVEYPIDPDVTVETPSATEIVVRGIDKQRVGQVAAEIRSFRTPDPYKGKGIRYGNERVSLKDAKKK